MAEGKRKRRFLFLFFLKMGRSWLKVREKGFSLSK